MVLGVCSWSLRPESPEDLVAKVRATGLSHVQLHLDPLRSGAWDEATTVRLFEESGISLVSGMMMMKDEDYSSLASIEKTGGVRPDGTWEDNLAAAKENAALAQRLGLSLVTLHAGFIPHGSNDPERATMVSRLRDLLDAYAAHGIRVGFETGQETAETLLAVLAEIDRDTVGVNFDPANMILYAMGDPVDGLRLLSPYVRQIHVKDAVLTKEPGTWGEEVPVGTGAVDWRAFFDAISAEGLTVDLMIEREAGENRIEDIRTAKDVVTHLWRPRS